MQARSRCRIAALLVLGVVGSSCSSGDSGAQADTKSSIAKSKEAVVQIDVTGTFADLESEEKTDQEGRGSGFIVSKDGLTLTNNHVVTGATKIKVRVPGREEPVSAKVLGASECADLAVIDLDGDGYTSLSFASQPADIGDEVYAVGYPPGRP